MAFTFGFYNSLNGDRKYNTEQISALFDGLIADGVFQSQGEIFGTTAGTGMQVMVKSGKAWFNHTWNLSDSTVLLAISPADVTLGRYDAVVLEVNSDVNVRTNRLTVVTGTPATNPVKPTMANTTILHQHPLAYVYVPANSTSVTQANIQVVVGTSECPFVTGIIDVADIDIIWAQWQAAFDDWFANLKYVLDGDVAGHLQVQIEELKESAYKTYTGTTEPDSSLGVNGDTYVKTR